MSLDQPDTDQPAPPTSGETPSQPPQPDPEVERWALRANADPDC